MPPRQPPIARIRLARSLRRLLGLPALALLAGLGAIGAGILVVPGTTPGIVLVGAGAIAVVLALVAAAILLSIRIEIEEAAVRIRRLGGGRRYELVPGPVTRVRLRGERASSLRSVRPVPGWQLGAARLRGEERIDVVRLAPTDTAILVPTDRGRLAIAAASEEELLSALSRAARARQRLAEAAAAEAAAAAAEADQVVEAPPEADVAAAPVATPPALMTGIERARFEAEQAAALAALEAATPAADAAAPTTVTAPDAVEAPGVDAAEPRETPSIPKRRRVLIRPAPSIALVLLPLVGAGAAWGIGLLLHRMPAAESDLGRLTALALVLAGPVATVGAIMARIWWPRIVGVVVAGGLAAAVFVGRSLIGG
jgi:hypothetical protein